MIRIFIMLMVSSFLLGRSYERHINANDLSIAEKVNTLTAQLEMLPHDKI